MCQWRPNKVLINFPFLILSQILGILPVVTHVWTIVRRFSEQAIEVCLQAETRISSCHLLLASICLEQKTWFLSIFHVCKLDGSLHKTVIIWTEKESYGICSNNRKNNRCSSYFSKIIGDRLSGKVTFVIYCITYNYVMCGHFLNGNIYNI